MLPGGMTQVRIVSRASRPCDVQGPFVDDRRMLGVLVEDIMMREGNLSARTLVPQIQNSTVPGWHAPDESGARWTNGSALLPLPATQPHALTVLTLTILSAGPYVREDGTRRACVNG